MKKKYLPKRKSQKETEKGAFDKNGNWWNDEELHLISAGVTEIFFGKRRQKIKLIEREIEESNN